MVGGLDFSKNGLAFKFNLNTFNSEIFPDGKSIEISLAQAIHNYFEFSEETKYSENCFFSKKFLAYILPLENHLEEKNFVMIKDNQIFNPNKFAGFAFGSNLSKNPYFINDMDYAKENGNWIYFSEPNKLLMDFAIQKYKVIPRYENNFKGQILKLLSSIPESWHFDGNSILTVVEPSTEDRTILINLLKENDFIEFEKDITIHINQENIELLASHCLTLYSTI